MYASLSYYSSCLPFLVFFLILLFGHLICAHLTSHLFPDPTMIYCYSLFKQVYSHRVGKAVEYMICDILKLANKVLKISDKIYKPEEYLTLTVRIFNFFSAHELHTFSAPCFIHMGACHIPCL